LKLLSARGETGYGTICWNLQLRRK
jgi:hypothetical protein